MDNIETGDYDVTPIDIELSDADADVEVDDRETLESLEKQLDAFSRYLNGKYDSQPGTKLARPFILESVWPIETGDVGISEAMVWQSEDSVVVVIPPYAEMSCDDLISVIWNGVEVGEERPKPSQLNNVVCVRVPSEQVPPGTHDLAYTVTTQLTQRESLPLATVVRFGQPGLNDLDEVVELPAPSVQVPATGLVDETHVAHGVTVTIPAYKNMKPYDRVHLFWGDERVEHLITPHMTDQPITLEVPGSVIRAAGNSDSLPVYYFIADEVENESEWSEDTFVQVAVQKNELQAPTIVDPTGDHGSKLDYIVDLNKLASADLNIKVSTDSLNVKDSVRLAWSGTTVQGKKVLSYSAPQEVKAGATELSFVVANADVTDLADGSAQVHYVATRGSENVESKRTFLSISAANPLGLPAPSLHNIEDDWIAADQEPVIVVIPASAGLQAGDQVSVIWKGTAGDGSVILKQPKTHSVSANYQGQALPLRLKGSDVLAPLNGGFLDISYSITRGRLNTLRPDALTFPGAPVGSLIMGISPDGERAPSTERLVKPPVYDVPNTGEGEVYFFINEGSTPFDQNSGALDITLGITADQQNLKPLMPDSLQDALRGHLNDVSTDNYVKIFDTPSVWGQPFGKGLMVQAEKRADEFESAISDMLVKMRYRCDIASLNAPDAAWREVLLTAIDNAFTTKLGRTDKTQIRFMLAQTPTVLLKGVPYYFTGTPEYLALKEALSNLVEERGAEWECVPDIWIGRYYKITDPLQEAIANKAGCEALVAAFDAKMTWNHTKIIAVDGVESFVGGHNLNMDLFRNYPPVHDVSVKVLGKAALAAQQFLNEMWVVDSGLLTKEHYDPVLKAWVYKDDDKSQPADPLLADHVTEFREAQYQDHSINLASQTEFKKSGYILSVGKYWSGSDRETHYKNGSEVMKEHLIKKAKRIIRMSQQDLVSAWKKTWSDHAVCGWIIEALLANPVLKVQVVVSPLDAGAGAEGDQYSFGSGARRTFELFKYFLMHDPLTDKPVDDSSGLRQAALKRIEVAPFFFTEVPAELAVEGDTYKWPDQSAEAHTATLKEPPLSARPPLAGVIGYPMHSLIKGSGFLGKIPSAPGNHAKVMIIDDELYVVGSDNLYPGFLAEFNYVIDGPDAVNDFIACYWNPLWKYSSKHSFNYRNT
ncbi:hypothetical protein R6U79_10770 [Pseudomonas putida]|uniref:hypothetical protein n=2 Tax=Pseudomonas putida TaxID=303 RepID=UPI0029DE86E4|nr:hypothetical protein [Pseudomonas putida]WPK02702.1 hypothetical protein R6U79_10770 [Pseudomonas putida]